LFKLQAPQNLRPPLTGTHLGRPKKNQENVKISYVPVQIPTGYHLNGNKDFFSVWILWVMILDGH